jgi:predicted nucleic acid-binding protein
MPAWRPSGFCRALTKLWSKSPFGYWRITPVEKVRLMAPDLFWAEVGNILWKSVRNGRISATSAKGAIMDLESLHLDAVPAGELLGDAFDIAAAFDRTVYDALYVALAIAADAPLVTADERLVMRLGSRFPVLWLGAYAGAN